MAAEQSRSLLKAQRDEVDAILMYNALADAVTGTGDAEALRTLTSEDGKDASVFERYTEQSLTPSRAKAVVLPTYYRKD